MTPRVVTSGRRTSFIDRRGVVTATHVEVEEQVDHPVHYTQHPSGIECIVVVEHMTFCVGNAVKYCWRAGLKVADGEMTDEARLRDLQKAAWYLRREIEALEKALSKDRPR